MWLATETGWARSKRSAICSGKLISGYMIWYYVNGGGASSRIYMYRSVGKTNWSPKPANGHTPVSTKFRRRPFRMVKIAISQLRIFRFFYKIYVSLFRQKRAVKKQTKTQTKINTQQERATQYQQQHYSWLRQIHNSIWRASSALVPKPRSSSGTGAAASLGVDRPGWHHPGGARLKLIFVAEFRKNDG